MKNSRLPFKSILALGCLFAIVQLSFAVSERLKILKATASSVENGNAGLAAENTLDGDVSTRWASDWKDPQWIMYDFGSQKSFNAVSILWENAYGKAYSIQVSDNALNWKVVFNENDSDGQTDNIVFERQRARYVRVFCTKRATPWGCSMKEFKAIDSDAEKSVPPANINILKGDNTLALEWGMSPEADVSKYNIYRSENETGGYQKIAEQQVEDTSFVDKSLVSGQTYYYRIRAVDFLGNESEPSKTISAKASSIEKKGTYLDPALSSDKRAKDLLARMTLEEKVEQMGGILNSDDMTSCGNERLGIPSIKCADGPWGVRWQNGTAFPVSIAVAATWDPEIARKIGVAMARELKAKGRNMSLGPCLNLCRDPRGGRVHEGFGEDPFLASRMAVAAITGLQSEKVIATPKHYACNNRERERDGGPVEIDERTLKELYLRAFRACVKEGQAWSIMGAYNKINGEFSCANKHILKDILKDEWGFKGFVISDWYAVHETSKSAVAGLDLEMPFAKFYGESLLGAVRSGAVPEADIDDSVRRLLWAKFQAGLFEPQENVPPSVVESKEHIALAKEAGRKSIVLLKNKDNFLPLDKNKPLKIAVTGPSAKLTTAGMDLGSGQVNPSYSVSPLDGMKRYISGNIKIVESVQDADIVVFCAGLSRDIAGRVEGEGMDREDLTLPGNQDKMIRETIAKNKNVVVVLIGGSAVGMNQWLGSVPAVVQAWYCGQEGGNVIAEVLFGDYNPGGKLPITFPMSSVSLPDFGWNYVDEYKKGIGYMYFDKEEKEPLFPFGHGLSYTKFAYSNLLITPAETSSANVSVKVDVKNTGGKAGDEVVQLYIGGGESKIERPVKLLKAFKRITLSPGESKTVTFKLTPEDLARYGADMKYIVEPGAYKAMVGGSSKDIRLTGDFNISKTISVR
ncbi:MAG: glycoside hydrolase family 3 C-terminal domain-containing protein [Elusimicrobiota bacterium]